MVVWEAFLFFFLFFGVNLGGGGGDEGGNELILNERILAVCGCEGLGAGDQDKLITAGLLIALYLRKKLATNEVYLKLK